MPAYGLRAPVEGEFEVLFALHEEAMRAYVVATWGPWEDDRQRELFAVRMAAGRLQVVEVDGRTAGILELSERLGTVYVDNIELAAQERRRGLGTQILRDVMTAAAERGRTVTLQVLHVNPARALYERLGFVETGRTATHVQMAWKHPGG